AFSERVVTRATATLKAWDANDFGPIPADTRARSNVYLNDGNDVLLAASVGGEGHATEMRGVTFYERDEAGMIVRQLRGSVARFADRGWRIEEPRVFEVGPAQDHRLAEPVIVARGITPGQVALGR